MANVFYKQLFFYILSSYTQVIISVEPITISLYIYKNNLGENLCFFPDVHILINLLAIERKFIFYYLNKTIIGGD